MFCPFGSSTLFPSFSFHFSLTYIKFVNSQSNYFTENISALVARLWLEPVVGVDQLL